MLRSSVGQSPPGRSMRPDRPLEEDVAAEQGTLVGDRVGDVPGAVAGREDHVDLEAGELELLAAGDGLVGVVALERAEAGPGHEGHDVGEHRHLELGAVDGGAGRLGDRGHGADVIEVAVGEQDRLELDSQLLDRRQQPRRLLAGIDDQALVGALAAEDVAVLGDRADGEAADLHRLSRSAPASWRSAPPGPWPAGAGRRTVRVVAERHVEDRGDHGQHDGACDRLAEDHRDREQQQREEHAPLRRPRPGRRLQPRARPGPALALLVAGLRHRLLAAAGPAASASVDAAGLRSPVLAALAAPGVAWHGPTG